MGRWLNWLLAIDSSDEDVRRRGRNLATLVLGILVLSLLFVPLTASASGMMVLVAGIIALTGMLLLVRRGMVMLSALLVIAILTLGGLAGIVFSPTIGVASFFLILPVLVASLVLRPWQIWPVLAVNMAGLALVIALHPSAPLSEEPYFNIATGSFMLLGLIGLISFLGARSTDAALRDAQRARAEAETAAGALEQANADLEQRVTERTAALSTALAAQQAQAEELQASLDVQQQLNQIIADLSLPIIPVRDDVLVVPLVGNLDSTRSEQLLDSVLQHIQAQRARAVILDVTGVAVVDTLMAQALLRTADAARLLGAEAVVVGIRPEVAQTLVSLGADLSSLHAAATLQAGLATME